MQESNKKCSVLQTDKIFFGNGGGGYSFVVLTKDKKAYKFFPVVYNKYIKTKKSLIDSQQTETNNEIKIGKHLSKYIIDRGVSPHFVKFYGYNNCPNIKNLFNKCPKFIDFLLEKKKNPLCSLYYDSNYPNLEYDNNFVTVSMEYCDYSCNKFIEDVSLMKTDDMKYHLDIFFFQIFYTLLATKKIYPFFYHRDFFIRNILGLKKEPSPRYYRYNYNNKIYDIPITSYMPKISDYGWTNLNEKYSTTKLVDSHHADLFNILYDVYNGANIGSSSLSKLLEKNNSKIKFIKKYFNTFFSTTKIDKLKELNEMPMDWNMTKTFDKDFVSYIKFINPDKIMLEYFSKIFIYDEEHEIEQEFYS